MRLRPAVAADHPAVVAAVARWWGGRDVSGLMQPLFLEHFATSSLIAEDDDGRMTGFLVGFPSLDHAAEAYVHFVGVDPRARGHGLGRRLHDAFATDMAARGVRVVRCVTSPVNVDSVAFHRRLGFEVERVDGEYVRLRRDLRTTAGRVDPRPADSPWPAVVWPVPVGTVLRVSSVSLTAAVPDDAPALFSALDDDAVWTHVRGRPRTVDELAATLADAPAAGRYPWTVRRGGDVVGTTSFLEVAPTDARLEVGHTLYTRAEWGTHVNPACKLLLMSWAFDEASFGRVQLKTDIRNHRSQAAIERLGARYEGTLRRYQRRADGTVRDTVVFSVSAEEWPAVRAGLRARLPDWEGPPRP